MLQHLVAQHGNHFQKFEVDKESVFSKKLYNEKPRLDKLEGLSTEMVFSLRSEAEAFITMIQAERYANSLKDQVGKDTSCIPQKK